ncbi:MAG TPA: hypothetical protein VG537_06565 [Candidatus Kapabacteria bacterium]|jgi:hypothetical protein|nr:hypothetical protein [Candidatus Kapabacteria bacterium]
MRFTESTEFVHYLQVHGQHAGPTQRPVMAGLITGFIASLIALGVLYGTGGLPLLSERLGISVTSIVIIHIALATVEGMIYGLLLGRAANAKRSAWLFGITYGYFLWVAGPVMLFELIFSVPVARYDLGIPIITSHLIYGISLGILFPYIHAPLHRRLTHMDLSKYGYG